VCVCMYVCLSVQALSSFERETIRTCGFREKLPNLIAKVYLEKYFGSGRSFGQYCPETGGQSKKMGGKSTFFRSFLNS